MNDSIPDVFVFILVIVGILFGALLATKVETRMWNNMMVKRGYAEYNQTNGKWQWKTNLVLTNITYFKN